MYKNTHRHPLGTHTRTHTRVLVTLLVWVVVCVGVGAQCNCAPDPSKCVCCVEPFGGKGPGAKQACVSVSALHDVYTLSQSYGKDQLNQLNFESGTQPEIQHANCFSNNDIGWCLLVTDFSTDGGIGSGNMTSTFVGTQEKGKRVGATVGAVGGPDDQLVTMWQGFFKVSKGPGPGLHSANNRVKPVSGGGGRGGGSGGSGRGGARARGVVDQCSSSCPYLGGCDCMSDGCACCSLPNTQDKACTQLTGFRDVKMLQANVLLNGDTWMAVVTNGDNPKASCTVNPLLTSSYNRTLCAVFENLKFSPQNLQGSTACVVTEAGKVVEELPLGKFTI